MATKYYFQELPREVKDMLWEKVIRSKKYKNNEDLDDFINRHNWKMSIDTWEDLLSKGED